MGKEQAGRVTDVHGYKIPMLSIPGNELLNFILGYTVYYVFQYEIIGSWSIDFLILGNKIFYMTKILSKNTTRIGLGTCYDCYNMNVYPPILYTYCNFHFSFS